MDQEENVFTRRGPFSVRYGKAKASGLGHSNKKLCLIATDKEFLVDLLLQLSERDECYFVKYSEEAKDGMHLGRVFLTDEELLGRLWIEYKDHPKLMCSIQDDDYTQPIRDRAKTV